jgi:ParB-like chromosome segregation protein Spo0J
VAPEAPISKVAACLAAFGFRQPIAVDEEGVVIVGHTRLLAAMRLGHTEVPVLVATGIAPEQNEALRIADTRTAQETSSDQALLPLELSELLGCEKDLALTERWQTDIGKQARRVQAG